MTKLLKVKDLEVSFETNIGKIQAVRGVSLDVKRGETLAIVGESGSGKSVVCKSLMRLNPTGQINNGKIIFKDSDIVNLTEKEMRKIRGAKISMVFQDPMTSLNPTMTVGKQVMEGLIYHKGLNKKQAGKRALELLELVGINNAEKRMKEYPHQFSGGMRQRVVIAIALSCNPEILIADEPTTALDVTIQAQILDLLNELKQKLGMAIIFVTHDLAVVSNIADRVAVMYAGRVVEIGRVNEIFNNPQHPYTWGLLGSIPVVTNSQDHLVTIPGTPPNLLKPPKGDAFAQRNKYALNIDFEKQPPLFKVTETHYAATWLLHKYAPKVDRPIFSYLKPDLSIKDKEIKFKKKSYKEKLIEVDNLKVHFKSRTRTVKAVDEVSFHIFKGETLGIVGESGSGKSTLGRAILGLYEPSAGNVYFKNESVYKNKTFKERLKLNRQMQMIFQDPYSSLNPRMTVGDIIAEGIDIHNLVVNKSDRYKIVCELIKTIGLKPEHLNRYPHEFSGGQRQRIGIARALAVNPEFIIADEPISALDVSVQAQVINLLNELKTTNNLTYMFITHDLSMARYISDRIAVMYNGKIVELAESNQLFLTPLHPYTKSLLSAIPTLDKGESSEDKFLCNKTEFYGKEGRILRAVAPGHLVSCTKQELAEYQSIYGKMKSTN